MALFEDDLLNKKPQVPSSANSNMITSWVELYN